VRVTSEDLAARLRRSAEQAVAIKRGEQGAGYIVRRTPTGRETGIETAPQLAPKEKELGGSA
jgi:hypothetical protein